MFVTGKMVIVPVLGMVTILLLIFKYKGSLVR